MNEDVAAGIGARFTRRRAIKGVRIGDFERQAELRRRILETDPIAPLGRSSVARPLLVADRRESEGDAETRKRGAILVERHAAVGLVDKDEAGALRPRPGA